MTSLLRWPARRLVGVGCGTAFLWWLGVTWGGPLVIRAVHSGRLPVLSSLMAGRDRTPVETYLAIWRPLARSSVVIVLTAVLILLAAVLIARHGHRRAAGLVPPHPPASMGAMVLIAGWAGLVTGLGEAYYLVLRAFYRHQVIPDFLNVSQHAVWMAPLADVGLFLTAGVALVAASRVSGRWLDQRTVVAALAWLGVFGVTMATDRLHWGAALVLSLGIAVQARNALSPGAGEVAALARKSVAWLVAVVLLLGLSVPLLERHRERRQVATAGEAAAHAPNVLFIVLDTERAASTSLHGAPRPTTPFLEELARQGAMFEWAIAPTSWTLPSHAAMFTGRETGELGLSWNTPLGDAYPTLAEAMSAGGYATAGFVANQFFVSDLFGLDRGFGRWEDQPIVPGHVVSHSWPARTFIRAVRSRLGNHQSLGRKTADAVNASFLAWLDRPRQLPFFAFLNYFDAHDPYLPPKPWDRRFSDTTPRYWIGNNIDADAFSLAERAELQTAYESSMAYLDDRLRQLFDGLRQRGVLQNTVVIVTSDHGEDFGESGKMGHQFDLTMPLIHVPLVMVFPGRIPAGTRVSAPVELRHLAATVLSLAGMPEASVAGESLTRFWSGAPVPGTPEAALSEDGFRSMVTDRHHFLWRRNGEERLFDYRRDYLEQQNLINDPALAPVRDSLRAALAARLPAGR